MFFNSVGSRKIRKLAKDNSAVCVYKHLSSKEVLPQISKAICICPQNGIGQPDFDFIQHIVLSLGSYPS